jgi:hypothetical protein
VARIPWSHFQWACTLILHRADAWFSANLRGNMIIPILKSDISSSNHDLDFYPLNTRDEIGRNRSGKPQYCFHFHILIRKRNRNREGRKRKRKRTYGISETN